jgi:hypothetical protein
VSDRSNEELRGCAEEGSERDRQGVRDPYAPENTFDVRWPLPMLVDASIRLLAGEEVYQRGGELVDVVQDAVIPAEGRVVPGGVPRLRSLPLPRLRELLEARAVWWKPSSGYVRVPEDVVKAIAARGEWADIRPVIGVCHWPVLRPDGKVASEAGYDWGTQLLLSPSVDVDLSEVVTHADAVRAVGIFHELLSDFPFVAPPHRSAYLAALLTVFARPAIDGPTPLLLIDANERGSGKTLLANLIGWICAGEPLACRTAPEQPEEWAKVILALARIGEPVVLIDNVTRMLRSDALDVVLTNTTYSDRLLGKSEIIRLPWRTVMIATSNNAMLSADLVRRSLHVRLEADESPERRDGFRYPDIASHVLCHRARYVLAALTILRAYVLAGRPEVTLRPMGSYEAWSRLVRAALVWAGEPDPAETQDALREGADVEREEWRALLGAWYAVFGDKPTRASDVVAVINDPDEPDAKSLEAAVLQVCNAQMSRGVGKVLGYRLRAQKGRVLGGFALEAVGEDRTGATLWRVRRRPSAGDAGNAGDVSGQVSSRPFSTGVSK